MVKFGIIGCGHIASRHAEAIINSELMELTAVCDVNPNAAESFGEKYGVKWYTDIDDMLGNHAVDLVNICTPSGLRVEIGLRVAEAGKHLVVEKPMALSLKEADRLIIMLPL
ncbi:Gfo/Idh/MocA family protein [Pelotomaculum propionicicum]|uniref:Gfo/Idh/MocA family protein n=1 Tax=Pelotomaculum propionicicum TaxID=258475 RepID=UPI003B81B783